MAKLHWVPIGGVESIPQSFRNGEWIDLDETVILPKHKHDSTPEKFDIYEVFNGETSARFATAEITAGNNSYYILSDEDPSEPVRRAEAIKAYLSQTGSKHRS